MFMMGFCCCGGCVVFRDQFARPSSTNIGDAWTEQRGDWRIFDEQLTLTAPLAGDIAYVETVGRIDPILGTSIFEIEHAVQATLRSTADGDQLGLILLLSADRRSALFCLLTIHDTAALLEIYRRTDGVDVLIGRDSVTAPKNTAHVLHFCQPSTDGYAVATLNGVTICRGWVGVPGTHGSVPLSNYIGGVYCGTVIGTPTWDDFELSMIVGDCPCGGCNGEVVYRDEFDFQRSTWDEVGDGTYAGGKLKTARAVACFASAMVPPDKFRLSMKTTVTWTPPTWPFADPWIGMEIYNGGGGIGSTAIWFWARPVWGDYYFDSTSGGGTSIALAPASGDTLELQITGDATDEVDIKCYVNGVLVHTALGVTLSLRDFLQFFVQLDGAVNSGVHPAVTVTEWDYYYQTITGL